MRKVIAVLLLLGVGLAKAEAPKVTWGGTFYAYNFFWQNADFNSNTNDGDMFWYMHGDLTATADFGSGVMAKITAGTWGAFGQHPISGEGPDGTANGVHLMEAYIAMKNLFGTPLSLTVGKKHVLYGDGLVIFDGGEDGVTQVALNFATNMFSVDLFDYRLVENGGFTPYAEGMIGSGTPVMQDADLFGVYAKAKVAMFNLEPYFLMRHMPVAPDTTDMPTWMGARVSSQPIPGLSFVCEFSMMGGDNGMGVNYKGKAMLFKGDYALPVGATVGAGYFSFSGDDPTTDDNELYEAALWNPFTNGFWQWWPGFGPAHLMQTAFGFALLAPFDLMTTNLNVINAHAGYGFGDLSLRADFWMYTKNQVAEGQQDNMGNEISLLAVYNYMKTVSLGLAIGYWMPGDYFPGQDAMLGGHAFIFKSF